MPPPLPWTERAVERAAHEVRAAWLDAVAQTSLSTVQQRRYAAGLLAPDSLLHPYQGNALAARVANLAALAQLWERGWHAYHLPARINWGQAKGARRSKRGVWYMAIPFTHSLASMPAPVARAARHLRPGQRLTGHPRAWGARSLSVRGMQPYVPRYARNVRPGYTHAPLHEGLTRRPARGGGSAFMTFRTITQQSPGWWIPGHAGVHLVPQVVRQSTGQVQQLIEDGARRDVEALLRQTLGVP